jgi:hypothetical protein
MVVVIGIILSLSWILFVGKTSRTSVPFSKPTQSQQPRTLHFLLG